jgi:hypothetical protein
MPACRSLGVLVLLHAAVALAQSDAILDSRAEYTLALRAYEARDYAAFCSTPARQDSADELPPA